LNESTYSNTKICPDKIPRLISPFPAIARNSDCTQNTPMPIHQPIDSTQSSAILAQRLSQVACNIRYSLMRLISSDNHIASIMDAMFVSTSPSIIGDHVHSVIVHHIYYTRRCDAAQPRLYYKHRLRCTAWPWHEPKESLFLWHGDPGTGPPHTAQLARLQCGNPSPHKNSFF